MYVVVNNQVSVTPKKGRQGCAISARVTANMRNADAHTSANSPHEVDTVAKVGQQLCRRDDAKRSVRCVKQRHGLLPPLSFPVHKVSGKCMFTHSICVDIDGDDHSFCEHPHGARPAGRGHFGYPG